MLAESVPNGRMGIARFVEHALSTVASDELPVVVAVVEECDAADVKGLLAVQAVAGAIVTAAVFALFDREPRLGVVSDDGNWRLPAVGARSLLMLTGGRLLNIKRGLSAWRSGIRYVLTPQNIETLHRVTLRRTIAQRLAMLLGANTLRLTKCRRAVLTSVYERRIEARLSRFLREAVHAPRDHFVLERIVLANDSLAAGGAERQLINTALALRQEGRDVSILCNKLGTDEFDFYRAQIEPMVPVQLVQSLLDIIAALTPGQSQLLGAMLRRAGLSRLTGTLPPWVVDDVVMQAANLLVRRPAVVHFWQDYTNIVGGLAAVLVGVPRIVLGMRNMAPHHFPYFSPIMAPVYRVLAACPNVKLVNNSRAGALDYAQWLGIDPDGIRVILNGVADFEAPPRRDVESWQTHVGLPAGRPVIGSIYRFWPEKDPMLWLEAAAAVAARRAEVVFLLVGEGPMRTDIERRAVQLGIGPRLFMPGTVGDVRVAIGSMDVFLMTSRVEGTPNVLIEAQFLGCPVVTTIAGGSAETVEHGATGWVVPDRDPQALAGRLLAILDDPHWRSNAIEAAPRFARGRFGIERMVSKTRDIYGIAPPEDAPARESRRS